MKKLLFLLKLSKSILKTLIIHLIFGPPKKSWSIKFHLMIKLIKEVFEQSIGEDLNTIRELNKKNPVVRLNGCKLELSHIPNNFRSLAEDLVKEFCIEEYGEYFVEEEQNWKLSNSLEIHTILPCSKVNETPTRTFYYFHGGALLFGTPKTYYSILSKLANLVNCRIIAIDYRKCPEVTVLSCIEDILAGWLYLTSQAKDGGLEVASNQIILGGDSAGGGLAARLTYFLKRTNRPNSAGLLLFSPSLDMTRSQPSNYNEADWDILPSPLKKDNFIGSGNYNLRLGFNRMAYLGSNQTIQRKLENYGSFMTPKYALKWPLVSPMLSEDLTNLPPHLIMLGGSETLRDEGIIYSKRIWNIMKSKPYDYALPPVILQVYEEMPHIFMTIPFYPRLSLVITRCSNFLQNCFNLVNEESAKNIDKLDYNYDDIYPYKANFLDEIDTSSEFYCYKQLPNEGLYKYCPEYEESEYEVWESKLTKSLPDLKESTSKSSGKKGKGKSGKRKQSKSK